MEEDIVMVSMRERSPDTSKNLSREALVSSTTSSKPAINRSSKGPKGKEVEIAKLPPIPVRLPKKVLEKSKFFGKDNNSKKTTNSNVRKLYAQATSSNILEILKLKDNFPNLLAKKIKGI